jgi:hypothetical protein
LPDRPPENRTYCRSQPRRCLESIRTNGIGQPFLRYTPSLLQALPPDTFTLLIGRHRYGGQIQRALAGGEVSPVDSPGLFGSESQGCHHFVALAGHLDAGVAHSEKNAFVGYLARPGSRAELLSQALVGGVRRLTRSATSAAEA